MCSCHLVSLVSTRVATMVASIALFFWGGDIIVNSFGHSTLALNIVSDVTKTFFKTKQTRLYYFSRQRVRL